eukprot:gene55744-76409_t
MTLNRKLAGVDSVTTQQFYGGLVATLCIAGFALGGWVWPHDLIGWICFVSIGAAALIGHQFITTAHRYAPASVLAPFGYLQMIFMVASSWIIFHQPPEIWIFVGAPIVIGSGLYIWLRERQLARPVITEGPDRKCSGPVALGRRSALGSAARVETRITMPVQLIDAKLPEFGLPASRPELSRAIYAARLDALGRARRAAGIDTLLIYADREHSANLAWLTGFDPRFEEA